LTPNQFTFHAHQAHRLLPHGSRPTKKHMRVARALGRHPSSMPSHRQLARAAECCLRTVQNALCRFRELGLLKWLPVYDRRLRPSDKRRRRPNLYLFMASFLFPPAPRVRARGKNKSKKSTPEVLVGKLSDEAFQALRVKWGLV
jgi:hypothetical protein